MAEQELAGAQVARFLVEQRYLRATEAVSPVSGRVQPHERHPLVDQPRYWRVVRCQPRFLRLGNSQSSAPSCLASIQAAIDRRACSVTSNWTGRPVFCWSIITRRLTPLADIRSETLSRMRSQPL